MVTTVVLMQQLPIVILPEAKKQEPCKRQFNNDGINTSDAPTMQEPYEKKENRNK